MFSWKRDLVPLTKSICIKILKKCGINKFNNKTQNTKRVIFVDFNAWSHSGSDVLWAGLIKTIHESIEQRFGRFGTRFFRFIYKFELSFWKLFPLLLSIILGFITPLSNIYIQDYISIKNLSLYIGGGITTFISLPSIYQICRDLIYGEVNKMESSYKNIKNKLGFMNDVKEEIEILCEMLYDMECTAIIFIDEKQGYSPVITWLILNNKYDI